MKAMLIVTEKRVTNLIARDGPTVLVAKNSGEKIANALNGPLGNGLAPGVEKELRRLVNKEASDVSQTKLTEEITKLLGEVGDISLASVSSHMDKHVKASFLHVEVAKGVKDLHAAGMGAVDAKLISELGADVETALEHGRKMREAGSKLVDDGDEDGIVD